MTQSMLSVGVFLALLACLPWLISWFKQRKGGGRELDGQSRVVSAVAIGPHQRVVTVEVGPDHARTMLVLGVTAQSITCLHTMDKSAINASEAIHVQSNYGDVA
jgi:flagellar protein FliO/FliZ